MRTIWLFPTAGLIMILFGAYVAGGWAITCARSRLAPPVSESAEGTRPELVAECRVEARRWLARKVVTERTYLHVTDVDAIAVSRTETSKDSDGRGAGPSVSDFDSRNDDPERDARVYSGGMNPLTGVNGLHHITAIAGPAQENLDFYAGVLGMRLVKKSVNQDDPGTYHLFYADAVGHPGADLTFFPWAHLAPARLGHGLAVEVSLEIPAGSLDYWSARLHKHGAALGAIENRFDDQALTLIDPDGLKLALVESAVAPPRRFTPWEGSPVPPERQIRGLYGAQIWEREARMTAAFLTDALGFEPLGTENGWTRYGFAGAAGIIDVREVPRSPQRSPSLMSDAPEMRRGAWGVGSVHHLAWRVDDEAHQHEMRVRVEENGAHPTAVIDRFWFKSVYFKEPGGVLFELATDGPGFSIDEDPEHLGEALILPPWLEPHRTQIEQVLPPIALRMPTGTAAD